MMITIELTNGFYIEVEPICYTLKRKRWIKKKNSDEKTENITVHGYYSNLNGAVKKFLFLRNLDENDGVFVTMTEYLKMIEKSNLEATNIIVEAVKGLVKKND